MSDSASTPLASSRRVKPTADGSRGNSRQRWNSNGADIDSPRTPNVKEPSSPAMLGKLSLALSNMRNLKEQLSQREAELLLVKSEKEKYQAEHGKLYSQITAIRTRCSLFESQLAKKALEVEELKKNNANLEFECGKLRKMVSDDTSKQTNRIRQLELQVSALKNELASRPSEDQNTKDELEELRRTSQTEVRRLTAESERLTREATILATQLEELRATVIKVSSEKASAQQEIEHLRQDQVKYLKAHKDVSRLTELETRLGELETERTNAKMALKKALHILDEAEGIRAALVTKDARIEELEAALKVATAQQPTITLPSLIDTLKLTQVEREDQPRICSPQPEPHSAQVPGPPTDELIRQKLDAFADTKQKIRQLLS